MILLWERSGNRDCSSVSVVTMQMAEKTRKSYGVPERRGKYLCPLKLNTLAPGIQQPLNSLSIWGLFL